MKNPMNHTTSLAINFIARTQLAVLLLTCAHSADKLTLEIDFPEKTKTINQLDGNVKRYLEYWKGGINVGLSTDSKRSPVISWRASVLVELEDTRRVWISPAGGGYGQLEEVDADLRKKTLVPIEFQGSKPVKVLMCVALCKVGKRGSTAPEAGDTTAVKFSPNRSFDRISDSKGREIEARLLEANGSLLKILPKGKSTPSWVKGNDLSEKTAKWLHELTKGYFRVPDKVAGGNDPSAIKGDGNAEFTVSIPANKLWPYALPVKKGELVRMQASGRWKNYPNSKWAGVAGSKLYLMGKLDDGTPFKVGADKTLQIERDGILHLSLREGGKYENNTGAVSVKFTRGKN